MGTFVLMQLNTATFSVSVNILFAWILKLKGLADYDDVSVYYLSMTVHFSNLSLFCFRAPE